MSSLLSSGLVEFADVANLVDGMIRSVDLNGPAECDECAANLWTILLVHRAQEKLNSAPEASENVLRWLFTRWSPGMAR